MRHFVMLSLTRVSTIRIPKLYFCVPLFLLFSVFLVVSPAAFAQGAEIEIGSGTVDHDRIQATRWARLNFTTSISGAHTIRVSWNNDADIRFTLFQVVDAPAPNNKVEIASGSGAASLKEVTEILSDSEQYYLGVWAASGSASFTANIEEEIVVADPLEIVSQPADQTVADGEDAIFTVAASGSGTLNYQWFEGTTAITGAISDTLTISPASLVDSGNTYSVVISDDTGSITSTSAILTVDEDVQSPVTLVTFGSGNLDSEKVTGPRWVQVDFDSLGTGTHTIAVSWDSDADVRFNVFESNGTRISGSAVKGSNPGVWVGELNATEQYYIGLWSNDGVANYTATVSVDTDTPPPLEIVTQPTDIALTEGENAIFTVVATGSGALSYQWFASTTEILEDNTLIINPAVQIPDATSDTLLVSSVTLADSLSTYSVVINDDNGSLASDMAILIVDEAPIALAITSQPTDLFVTEGEDAVFTVVADGSGTLSYQWFANNIAISGATDDTLTISPTSLADSSTAYSVVVNDDNGSVASDTVTLTVNEVLVPLVVTEQPVDLTVNEGEDAVFSIVATGSGALSYQWFANTVAINGATEDTLTLSSTTLADTGTGYSVVVTDDNGSIDSEIAILVVVEEVVLPVSIVEIGQGTLDSEKHFGPRWVRIDFNSLATAMHTITVSWDSDADVRFNVFEASDDLISNQIVHGANPGIWAGELNANEQYYIALWSTNGIANYTATIEANVPVSIDSQPLDLIVTEGENATFTVAASGSGTLSYQWFANGVALPGETGDSLTVFATSLADDGTEYTVDVGNSIEAVTSDIATLTVNEPVILGFFSQEADTSTWVLDGPAPTLDFQAGEDTLAWGRVLLRVGDVLLVGGDFEGIKPTRTGPLTERPWLAALSAVTGQPVSTFQVPFQVDSVVRALVLSPSGDQVYVGGDFGLLVLDATTGELDIDVNVANGDEIGRVFDIAVTQSQVYIGGDFSHVDNTFRANIARLSLNGELDLSWSPNVTNGFSNGRSAPVQAIAVSTSGDTVYVGGNFSFIDGVAVDTTPQNGNISLLAVSAIDETVKAERFSADVNNNNKALQVHDIAVTDSYVIVAWGGPNFLTFHSLSGDRLEQYRAKGDVQALQIVGNHLFVGHHGEFFGTFNNPVPQEAVISIDPEIVEPYKMHSFRIDDPSFPVEQTWQISGAFGIWGIAAAEDSIWLAGQVFRAGSNEHLVDGLVRFPAVD